MRCLGGSGCGIQLHMPVTRRLALTAAFLNSGLLARRAEAATQSFDAFLEGVRADARRAGVSAATVQRALSGIRANDRVLELDRRQPEFTQTWEQYRDARLSQQRIDAGRRDIWDNRADALGSIGNYLARSGWRDDELWGREVVLPAGFDPEQASRTSTRPLREWVRMGVRRADGQALPALDMEAAILIPGPSGQAFAVYHNFNVIRRYNPSNFYALAVGLLSDRVA